MTAPPSPIARTDADGLSKAFEPAVDPVAELALGERQREMVDVLRATDRSASDEHVVALGTRPRTQNGHIRNVGCDWLPRASTSK